MSDVKLRVALLGAGRIGQEHSRTLIADPRVQVVAVCDPRLEAARQTAATIPGAVATDESREILSSSGVDAIIICTPTDSHALLIEEGARAHKAVFCEKPVALDLQRTRQALRVLEESGVPFQIGFQRRFDSGYAEARNKTTIISLWIVSTTRFAQSWRLFLPRSWSGRNLVQVRRTHWALCGSGWLLPAAKS